MSYGNQLLRQAAEADGTNAEALIVDYCRNHISDVANRKRVAAHHIQALGMQGLSHQLLDEIWEAHMIQSEAGGSF